jgi:hypothetical protein
MLSLPFVCARPHSWGSTGSILVVCVNQDVSGIDHAAPRNPRMGGPKLLFQLVCRFADDRGKQVAEILLQPTQIVNIATRVEVDPASHLNWGQNDDITVVNVTSIDVLSISLS